MGISFLILSFIFIFSIFLSSYEKKEAVLSNFRLAFIKSSLIISLLVVIFTELLSFFKILTHFYIILLWLLVCVSSLILLIFLIIKNKYSFNNIYFDKILLFLKQEKYIFFLIFFILVPLFFIALTINNNWDSYTYHLPRIEHWIQNKNVDFYPTNNIRQLYLAPFVEYFILNIKLLSGNNLFINFVQFFAFINCLLGASLIAKLFKLNASAQLWTLVLALTLPMGILQATTTQTDLATSFFLITFAYFIISIVQKKKISKEGLFFLCLSFSLGTLTKATFYIFTFPFCLIFGIYYIKLFKNKAFFILTFATLTFLSLNYFFLNRNYEQFGSPLGPKKTAPYYIANLNTKFGIKETLSNGVKNIGLHLPLPNTNWNNKVDATILSFHKFINFPLNSPATTWPGTKYKTNFTINQDTIGNFFHIILFLFSLIILFINFKKIRKILKGYVLAIIASFLLFAFLLKWQPWQTRLDLPIFFLMTPLLAYALSLLKQKIIIRTVCIFLLFISITILFVYNPTKPILGKNSIFLKNNHSYIFDYDVAIKVESELEKNNISSIGLFLDGDSWEWQYWLLSKNRRFEYVLFNHDLLKTPNFNNNFKYRAIIATNSLWSPQRDKHIFEIFNIDEKTTLVIYKEERNDLTIQ